MANNSPNKKTPQGSSRNEGASLDQAAPDEPLDIYSLLDDLILDHDLKTGKTNWKNTSDSPFDLLPTSPLAEWEALMQPEDLENTVVSLRAALQDGDQKWTGTYWLKDQNDTYQLVQDRRTIQRDEQGNPSRIIAILRAIDLTNHLKNRQAKIFDLAGIGTWKVDLLSGKLKWSDKTRQIHETPDDYTPSLEEGIFFFKEGLHRKLVQTTLERVQNGQQDFWDEEVILVTHTGKEKWVHVFGQVEKINGRPVKIFGSFQDITERKLAQIDMEYSQKRYKLATKAGTIGIWEWHFSQKRIHLDEVMLDLYQFSSAEKKRPLSTLKARLHPDDLSKAFRELEAAIEKGGNYQSSFRICLPTDQSVRHIKAFGDIVFDASGCPVTMIGVNIDVTDEVERNLKLQRTITEKEEILNNIKIQDKKLKNIAWSQSHEVRAPLANIMGLTALIREEYASEENADTLSLLDMLADSSAKLDAIIRKTIMETKQII